ncbi:hypothetical protein SpAn4DRAFT_1858 [Sporomusa ovata]|uniref:Uncharacterized protein n=1 Tax=Sporomusa ovata TaxID=2378 RepID=A0A0U1KTW0_9FIRM|nr:hypothetical protein SpAn4DRAFT_1858 [Sporomusa ovata]
MPPMGKMNSGQKQMGIMMRIGGILLIVPVGHYTHSCR